MKRIYISLFLILILSCKQKEFAQVPPLSIKKNNTEIRTPETLKNYYKGIDFNKKGQTLYEDLAVLTIAKHTNFLTYYDRHNYLYKADASIKNPDKVVLMYTGEERYWREYISGSNSYTPQTFNTEHIYPQSKYQNNAKGDLHHLRSCDKKINSSRNNLSFAEGTGKAGRVKGGWYPGDEWKGDVARMILYLNLRYNEKLDSQISVGGIKMLLKWNEEDPVSDFEKQRNNIIEEAQGNRNPFIDFPQLAYRIYE